MIGHWPVSDQFNTSFNKVQFCKTNLLYISNAHSLRIAVNAHSV